MPAVDLADVVNAADILVRHLTGHAHFTMETRERGAVAQQVFGKKLQRDGLAQFEIVGAIDFAHAAFSEQAHDAITLSQHLARHKPGIVYRIERRIGTTLLAAFIAGFLRRSIGIEQLGG